MVRAPRREAPATLRLQPRPDTGTRRHAFRADLQAKRRALISVIDWLVVGLYVAGIVAYGLLSSRRNSSPEDYFLASRSAGWVTIGLALIASNISSTALVGLAGAAYSYGVSVYNYEWSAAVILVFYCVFFLPQVLTSRVYTMPEFLERRYDARARRWLACLTLFLSVFVDGAGALYSGSIVCRRLIPTAPLWVLALALASLAAAYTVAGGLRAVLRTEVVQAGVLLTGAVVIAFFSFARAGGWHDVMASASPASLSLIRPADDPSVPWPGLLFGVPLLGFYYWCSNQVIVQRILSARNADEGRSGALFAGLLKLPVLFLMVLPGVCAFLIFPNVGRADLIYPTLIGAFLPHGLSGFLLAGFIVATMTAVASMLTSASTLITMDLVGPGRFRGSGQKMVSFGRLSTALCLVVSTIWAPQIERMPSLWQYLQAVLAYAVPPVVAAFVVGLFWRRANATGANATFLVGSLCGAGLLLVNGVLHVTHLHFLYVAPILFTIDVLILVSVSLWWPAPEKPGSAGLHWSAATFRAESARLAGVPAWRNYRWQAAGLLFLTAVIVYRFR